VAERIHDSLTYTQQGIWQVKESAKILPRLLLSNASMWDVCDEVSKSYDSVIRESSDPLLYLIFIKL
jgi:hypothetical protein